MDQNVFPIINIIYGRLFVIIFSFRREKATERGPTLFEKKEV